MCNNRGRIAPGFWRTLGAIKNVTISANIEKSPLHRVGTVHADVNLSVCLSVTSTFELAFARWRHCDNSASRVTVRAGCGIFICGHWSTGVAWSAVFRLLHSFSDVRLCCRSLLRSAPLSLRSRALVSCSSLYRDYAALLVKMRLYTATDGVPAYMSPSIMCFCMQPANEHAK